MSDSSGPVPVSRPGAQSLGFNSQGEEELVITAPAGKETQPIAIGPQYFYHFSATAPEDEDMPGERVIFQRILDL